ncbi:hypothetical protein [Celeribacter persicus]|jgi:hypothetical protein|uniref:Uncharacterized protein n=1 Tax=Celeribacter persicus TaxID=1651082 RepID=A0A2T5HGN9_9RHOB|nr:hypothetical protein [Celeribacter persicus]PTQ70733.1 hypothetical protein C8N42_10962 [Celeribacter persicus]
MTLHDAKLKDAAAKETTMKVSEWLEYYAPSTPAVNTGEQMAPRKLDVLDQMYAYYE